MVDAGYMGDLFDYVNVLLIVKVTTTCNLKGVSCRS